jgi:sec-independent protein translocase protein TatA
MGTFGIWHWIVVIGLAVLLFGGRGKISGLMGDMAQGIKAFKKGMSEDDSAKAADPVKDAKTIEHTGDPSLKTRAETERKVEGSNV